MKARWIKKALLYSVTLTLTLSFIGIGLVTTATAGKGDTLIIGVSHTPPTVDQDICLDPVSFYLIACIQEQGLDYPQVESEEPGAQGVKTLNFSGEWKLIPRLFESWEKSADGKSTTFNIRKGCKSAYGNEFTAKDFIYRYERGDGIKGFGATYIRAQGTSIELLKANVIDDYTVQVVADEPNGLQRLMAGNLTNGFYDATESEKHATADDPWTREWMKHHAPHFGAYYITEWKADEHVLLEANPNFWRGAPKIKRIIFKVIPESSSRVAMIRKGEIDIALELAPREIESLKGVSGVRTVAYGGGGWTKWLIFNQKVFAPFKEKKVRQALNYAIPREQIIDTVYYGSAMPLLRPMKMEYPGALPGEEFPYHYDLDKAKKLLAEAGYSDGFELELPYDANLPLDEGMAILIRDSFAKIGVNLKLSKTPAAVFYGNLQTRTAPMSLVGDIPFTPDMNYAYQLTFHSEAYGNYGSYKNEEADRLGAVGRTITEPKKRMEHHYKLQRVLLEDPPVGYIVQDGFRCAITDRVKGFNTYIGDNIKAEYLYFED